MARLAHLCWKRHALNQLTNQPTSHVIDGKYAAAAALTDVADIVNKLCGRPPQYAPPLQVDFLPLTLKVVSESRVTWATSVPILVKSNQIKSFIYD